MNKNSLTSFITIILFIDTCMTLIELPTLGTKSITTSYYPSVFTRRQNFPQRRNPCYFKDKLIECPNNTDFFFSYKSYSNAKTSRIPQSVQNIPNSYNPFRVTKLTPRVPLLGKLNGRETLSVQHYALKPPDPIGLHKELTSNVKHTKQTSSLFSNNNQPHILLTSPIPHQTSVITRQPQEVLDLITSSIRRIEGFSEITGGGTITTTPKNLMRDRDLTEETSHSVTDNAISVHSRFKKLKQVLNQLERNFYRATFNKLLSISPKERQENGISFAQSGLFLYLALLVLCTETPEDTEREIKESMHLNTSCTEQIQLLQKIISSLPTSSNFTKFHWSSRLILGPHLDLRDEFHTTASALKVHLDRLNNTGDPEQLTKYINQMVEIDSGGAMRDTFDEDELTDGVCAMWLTTMYMRARWRSAPTVLNGSRPFYDGNALPRSVRMIRINDVIQYADLVEWDAEAIEIRYADPELTLLLLVPRTRSLKMLANWVSNCSLDYVYEKMKTRRVAVILPIYTLRMTLLLPSKLEMMGLSRLVNVNMKEGTGCNSLKLSHATQRIMFWAEAGRNAFKDDGLEWDDPPEIEAIVDRPYIFFVRWRNLTLLNGNFVL